MRTEREFLSCSDFLNFEELCSFVLEQLYVKRINQPLLPAERRRLKTLSLIDYFSEPFYHFRF